VREGWLITGTPAPQILLLTAVALARTEADARMTRRGKDVEIVSVSLPPGTVREMDRAVKEVGYPSRSELVRDAVKGLLRSKVELEGVQGHIEGAIILLYDHEAEVDVGTVRHEHMAVFTSFMHTELECREGMDGQCPRHCCEVLMFSGDAVDVRSAHNRLKGTKHVTEVLVFIA